MTLDRRDFLKVLAGVPILIGLPGGSLLAAPQDGAGAGAGDGARGEGADPVAAALATARRLGRHVLLITVPGGQDFGHGYARRQRTARRLAGVLERKDLETRLLLAQLTMIVAPPEAFVRADPRLADAVAPRLEAALREKLDEKTRAQMLEAGVAAESAIALVAPGAAPDEAGAIERLDAVLDGAVEDVDALLETLRARLFGDGKERLRATRDAELARLAAGDRRQVDAALAALGASEFGAREKASAFLTERRPELAATLAWQALHADDAEVRIRSAEIAVLEERPVPLGTRWGEFHGGCGQTDPYEESPAMVGCGMARLPDGPKIYLQILAMNGK